MGYLRRNPSLVVGIALLGALGLFMIIGHLVVDTSKSRPLSAPAVRAPSAEHPFGTDRQGRDLLATMVAGTPLTLRIGFIAGFLGVGIGAILGFVSAYYRGTLDTVILDGAKNRLVCRAAGLRPGDAGHSFDRRECHVG